MNINITEPQALICNAFDTGRICEAGPGEAFLISRVSNMPPLILPIVLQTIYSGCLLLLFLFRCLTTSCPGEIREEQQAMDVAEHGLEAGEDLEVFLQRS